MAILAPSIPAHRFWPLHGEKNISNLPYLHCSTMLSWILKRANNVLEKKEITVVFLQHVPQQPGIDVIDPKRNLLLAIQTKDGAEPIDILDLKALDETSLKPEDLLVEEVIEKVRQHLAAKKTQGILFSSSGSKLDQRLLDENQFAIDGNGYLRLNGNRLCVSVSDTESKPLQACQLRTYTIIRAVLEGHCVHLFDEYDLVRLNKRTMFIDLTVVHHDPEGSYYFLERGASTPFLNAKLEAWFQKFAALEPDGQ